MQHHNKIKIDLFTPGILHVLIDGSEGVKIMIFFMSTETIQLLFFFTFINPRKRRCWCQFIKKYGLRMKFSDKHLTDSINSLCSAC